MRNLTLIVLTKNEAIHIERCLKSVSNLASQIIIVDSGSTDETVGIAKKFGAEVSTHPFINQADQFNWALDNLSIKGEWILKLDADEYLTPELAEEIKSNEPAAGIDGYYIKRRVYFMGRWMKHGGYYPIWFLRLWRKGKGRSEERKVDEHVVLSEGSTANLKNDFVDDNEKDLSHWIGKHNDYASREAEEAARGEYGSGGKRIFYYKLPPFLRVFLYFMIRYFFRLGFLDGREGMIFHFLHAFWYRFLVDSKIFEIRRAKNE